MIDDSGVHDDHHFHDDHYGDDPDLKDHHDHSTLETCVGYPAQEHLCPLDRVPGVPQDLLCDVILGLFLEAPTAVGQRRPVLLVDALLRHDDHSSGSSGMRMLPMYLLSSVRKSQNWT